jgi:biopolymer transport protein ExbD
MSRRRSRAESYRRRPRVELLPLLDAVFLVLAVFLLGVVRMVRSYTVPIDLPAMASGVEQSVPSLVLLGVDPEGRVFLGGEELSLERIEAEIGRRASDDPELPVLLQADRRARHGDVSALLDAVRASGATRVLLVAAPGGEDGE